MKTALRSPSFFGPAPVQARFPFSPICPLPTETLHTSACGPSRTLARASTRFLLFASSDLDLP